MEAPSQVFPPPPKKRSLSTKRGKQMEQNRQRLWSRHSLYAAQRFLPCKRVSFCLLPTPLILCKSPAVLEGGGQDARHKARQPTECEAAPEAAGKSSCCSSGALLWQENCSQETYAGGWPRSPCGGH